MDENIEDKINEIGAKFDIVKSLSKGLNSAILGTDELESRDGCSMAILLEEKINDLLAKHEEIVKELKI